MVIPLDHHTSSRKIEDGGSMTTVIHSATATGASTQSAAVASHPEEFISVKEAARLLGKSRSSVYRLNRGEGPLIFTRRGRNVLILAASFESYLAARKVSEPASVPRNSKPATGQAPVNATSHGSGQRELTLPWRDRPIIATFLF